MWHLPTPEGAASFTAFASLPNSAGCAPSRAHSRTFCPVPSCLPQKRRPCVDRPGQNVPSLLRLTPANRNGTRPPPAGRGSRGLCTCASVTWTPECSPGKLQGWNQGFKKRSWKCGDGPATGDLARAPQFCQAKPDSGRLFLAGLAARFLALIQSANFEACDTISGLHWKG